jgi:RsiW-degrading membrane proteinase PrsW (M82 family)
VIAWALALPAARRWAWLLTLLTGAGLFELVRLSWLATHNPNLLPSLVLLGSAVAPISVIVYVYSRDGAPVAGPSALAAYALVGGVLAAVVAVLLEYAAAQRLHCSPAAIAAAIEESCKLIGPSFAVLLLGVRRRIDGLVIGVATGAGFAVLETLGYVSSVAMQTRGDTAAIDQVLFERALLSPATHLAWTGLAAMALANAAARSWRPAAAAGLVVAVLTAVGLHLCWDSVDGTGAHLGLAAISVASIPLAIRWTGDPQLPPQHEPIREPVDLREPPPGGER